jgi:tripartite-type tricarboxylate transporter receptor subunit TctC
VMSAQVNFMFYHPAAVVPHMKSGKLRALAASSARRSAAVPEVPAIAESGYDFDLVAWFMLYAPAATPAPVLARLREAAAQALVHPEIAGKLKAQGLESSTMRADELPAFGRAELSKWADLVRRSGAQVD